MDKNTIRYVLIACVLLVFVFVCIQIAVFASGNVPKVAEYLSIPLGDWLTSIVSVGFGVLLAGVLSAQVGKDQAATSVIITELVELRHKICELLIVFDDNKFSDDDKNKIMMVLQEINSKLSLLGILLNKQKTNQMIKTDILALKRYFMQLRDILTGENWGSMKYNIKEISDIKLYSHKMQVICNGIMGKVII